MDKDKLIEFRRIQWSSEVSTLSRIKEDEQKWLFYAFATFGGAVSLYLSGKGLFIETQKGFFIETQKCIISPYNLYFFIVLILQVFILFWVGQALNLRQQYYTTLSRMIRVAMDLDEVPPQTWRVNIAGVWKYKKLQFWLSSIYRLCWITNNKIPDNINHINKNEYGVILEEFMAAENWRRNATAPKSSKLSEISMVVFLFIVVLAIITLSLLNVEGVVSELLFILFSVISALSLFIWPLFIYPIWDRCKLRKVYWNDVRHIQAKCSKVNTQRDSSTVHRKPKKNKLK